MLLGNQMELPFSCLYLFFAVHFDVYRQVERSLRITAWLTRVACTSVLTIDKQYGTNIVYDV